MAQLAAAGLSPGLMSAGLGKVPAAQTYLDVGQGNRVFDSLYDTALPRLDRDRGRWWREVVERAEAAPAEIVPGLLRSTLALARFTGYEDRDAALAELPRLVADAGDRGLLIAIERPGGESDAPLAIGVAGEGFDGNLTSDTTRTDGYVLSTDVAPTILERAGVEIPAEMSGQPIRGEGSIDVGAIESLGERMGVISHRRGPVIGLSLLAWILALGLAVALTKGALARPAVRARRPRGHIYAADPARRRRDRARGERRSPAGDARGAVAGGG